jgi:hypothetical protein
MDHCGLKLSREHQGFQNPQGSGVGYMRVRVRVGILYPCKILTLSRGSGVYTYPQLGVRGMYKHKNICKYHIYSLKKVFLQQRLLIFA